MRDSDYDRGALAWIEEGQTEDDCPFREDDADPTRYYDWIEGNRAAQETYPGADPDT